MSLILRGLVLIFFTGFVVGIDIMIYNAVIDPTAKGASAAESVVRNRRQVYAADEVTVDGATEVVGLVVNGHPRAYVLSAFASMSSHIYNDYIQGTAVSITYCGLDDYARVFAKSDTAGALNIGMAGRFNERMYCYYDGLMFRQDAANLPLGDHAFKRKRWSEWLEEHPDTDVYIGDLTRPLGL